MDKIKILVTGGNGYIAKNIKKYLNFYDITSITRDDFNLCDYNLTNLWFKNKYFDVIIHTAISGGSRLVCDDIEILNKNLQMYYNLYAQKDKFKKFISFGSGAEIFNQNSPYGKSKKIISNSIEKTKNFYNLRIFGVFDHEELNTRFIKSNILRYINREPLVIHDNKIMDFIYMKDFINILKYYIENDNLCKTINCSYEQKYTLKSIANIINTLDEYKVPLMLQKNNEMSFYCGNAHGIDIQEIGLYNGIIETYNKIKSN